MTRGRKAAWTRIAAVRRTGNNRQWSGPGAASRLAQVAELT